MELVLTSLLPAYFAFTGERSQTFCLPCSVAVIYKDIDSLMRKPLFSWGYRCFHSSQAAHGFPLQVPIHALFSGLTRHSVVQVLLFANIYSKEHLFTNNYNHVLLKVKPF